jgi:hypothetical protein
MRLNRDLRESIELLNLNEVDYAATLLRTLESFGFEAWTGHVQGSIDGISVPFVGLEDRLKDKGDAEELRKRRGC